MDENRNGYEIHIRNVQAEMEYQQKVELDNEMYTEVVEVDEITITGTNYNKHAVDIYALLGRSRDED
jgi:hypothetical protein